VEHNPYRASLARLSSPASSLERLNRRRFLTNVAALLMVGAGGGLLASCSAPSTPSPPATAPVAVPTAKSAAAAPVATAAPAVAASPVSTGSTPATPAQPTAAARRAPTGELKVAIPAEIISLDPHGAAAAGIISSTGAGRQFLDSLVVRDPASGEIKPSLASAWQTPNDTTWVFTLRPNVKFHDGTALTSADVKASIERVVAQKGTLAPLWADLSTIETPDPTMVRIQTKQPNGTLLGNATTLLIGPADRMNAPGFWDKPVGTGPFKFVSWKQGSDFLLEANVDYWDGPPGVKSLVLRDIPEEVARVTALETGEIQFTRGVSPDQLPSLQGNSDLRVESVPSWIYLLGWMNSGRAPFTDKRVRQAMWYALDLDTIIKDLLQGAASHGQAPVPATVFGFAAQTPYAYDPARAQQLLADVGMPNGFETSISWADGSAGPQGREIIQAMISYWAKVGVRVQNAETERAQWAKDLVDLNWDMTFLTNTVLTGDADYTLRRLYTSSANRTGYKNPDLDKLLDQAASLVDQNKRKDVYAQANKTIWDDAVGIFPADLLETYVYRKNLSGVTVYPDQSPRFHGVIVG
jgi:peptide/nickel transport system substrate-binding protein